MDVELRIRRFNPETDESPHWETYTLAAEPTDRVLDLLHQVKWYQDGTLTFRRSCAHGVCGSDAMVINGRNRLACETLVKDTGNKISVEALRAVPLVKDLLVDMDGFMDKYKQVMPFLVNDEPTPADGKERRQSQAERERYDDTTKCILCAACTTACPVFWTNPDYVGPAAIVNAHRFIFDSRDQAHEERLEIMADADGVWRCRTVFNCVEACPRGINVTGAIMEVIGEIQKAGAS
jgi:succinate dehydrogenase / fumarate reductase, iron-sulfur subunit